MSFLGKTVSVRTLFLWTLVAGVLAFVASRNFAAVPGVLSYQGRVLVSNAPFNGAGQFRFALVDTNGATTYWSNDGTSTAGSQPTAAVTLTVTNGLYSVLLGDSTITNMTNGIPSTVFSNFDVRLRVWFNDGTSGVKQLTPDQRIAPVGYAMVAMTVDDGAITTAKIADGAVSLAKIKTASSNGVLIGSGSNGSGAAYSELTLGTNLSVTGNTLNAAGKLVNYVKNDLTTYTAYTGVTSIPLNDTVPQSNQGVNWLTSAPYTPSNASNLIVIVATCQMGETTNSANSSIQALFKDSSTSAFAASFMDNQETGVSRPSTIVTKGSFIAGSTASFVIKANASLDTGTTLQINGAGGSRFFGGLLVSSIEIWEYAP